MSGDGEGDSAWPWEEEKSQISGLQSILSNLRYQMGKSRKFHGSSLIKGEERKGYGKGDT